jgi:hypothetical protein
VSRFEVVRVDDVPERAGILLTGREQEGMVTVGTTLLDEPTGNQWLVQGLEFPTPWARQEGLTILRVARTGAEPPRPGAQLTV